MRGPPPVAANQRDERYGTGAGAGVHASRLIYTYAPPGFQPYEWNLTAILNNDSRLVDKTENCALYVQSRSYDDGAMWGGCIEACDETFGAKYGPQVSLEIDQWVNGPDPYNWRLGLHIVAGDARRIRTGEARGEFAEVGSGILLSNNGTDVNAKFRDAIRIQHFWDSAITIEGGPQDNPSHHLFKIQGSYITGFSFAGATFKGSPIRLGSGQTIAFEGTDSVTIGLHGTRVEIRLLGQPVFALDYNTGDLFLKGNVKPL